MGFLPECLERVHSALEGRIDRSRKVRFLDKELREMMGASPRPRQHVDVLAEVPVKDPDLDWVPFHVEVQRSRVSRFAHRMLFYHAALVRRFRRPVMSLAILADPDPKWRPTELTRGIGGISTRFEFPICKLLDFTDAELESDPNPVNLVILAERVLRRHREDPVARREEKLALFRRMAAVLESKRYSQEQRLVLTRVLDWSIPLPESEERVFLEQLRQMEGDVPMTYLTTFERHARREGLEAGRKEGLEKGRDQGLRRGRQEGLATGLERGQQRGRKDGLRDGWVEALKALVSVRFPDWKPSWNRHLESLNDAELLQDWLKLAAASPSGAAFLKAIGKRPR